MQASSHCIGKTPSFSDFWNSIERGVSIKSDISFNKHGCHPGDFPELRFINLW